MMAAAAEDDPKGAPVEPDLSSRIVLITWSEWNALILLSCSGLLLLGVPIGYLLIMPTLSFLTLIIWIRNSTPLVLPFGIATWITIARLVGILALPLILEAAGLNGFMVAAGVLLLMDGLEGWLTRMWRQTSEFGQRWDRETEAFFMLVLCWMLFSGGYIDAWILIPGCLRYFFVLLMKIFPANERNESRIPWRRYLWMITLVGLLSCFFLPEKQSTVMALLLGLALSYSFVRAYVILHMRAFPSS